jgi:hypothetical protein
MTKTEIKFRCFYNLSTHESFFYVHVPTIQTSTRTPQQDVIFGYSFCMHLHADGKIFDRQCVTQPEL